MYWNETSPCTIVLLGETRTGLELEHGPVAAVSRHWKCLCSTGDTCRTMDWHYVKRFVAAWQSFLIFWGSRSCLSPAIFQGQLPTIMHPYLTIPSEVFLRTATDSRFFHWTSAMEDKYTVNLTITDLIKISRKRRKRYMVAYGKCKCGLTPPQRSVLWEYSMDDSCNFRLMNTRKIRT